MRKCAKKGKRCENLEDKNLEKYFFFFFLIIEQNYFCNYDGDTKMWIRIRIRMRMIMRMGGRALTEQVISCGHIAKKKWRKKLAKNSTKLVFLLFVGKKWKCDCSVNLWISFILQSITYIEWNDHKLKRSKIVTYKFGREAVFDVGRTDDIGTWGDFFL